jgi:hypothetical protein
MPLLDSVNALFAIGGTVAGAIGGVYLKGRTAGSADQKAVDEAVVIQRRLDGHDAEIREMRAMFKEYAVTTGNLTEKVAELVGEMRARRQP